MTDAQIQALIDAAKTGSGDLVTWAELKAVLEALHGQTSLTDLSPTRGKMPVFDGDSWEVRNFYEADLRDFNGYDSTGENDVTTCVQTALNQLSSAGGGTLFVPYINDTYKIAGALQTSVSGVNPNCQLYFPLNVKADRLTTIRIVGQTPPNMSTEGVEFIQRNQRGVIFESTILGSGTTPSVFGTPWANAGATGDRNFFECIMENMIVRTRTKTGGTDIAGDMSGCNFEKMLKTRFSNFKVDVTSALRDMVDPVGQTYGLILPNTNNQALIGGDIVFIEGYRRGIIFYEHARFDRLLVGACKDGIVLKSGYHGNSIQHLNAEVNETNIVQDGTSWLWIGCYDTEHYTSSDKWFQHQYDIRKDGGSGHIVIQHAIITESGVGNVNNFLTSGSPGYTIYRTL